MSVPDEGGEIQSRVYLKDVVGAVASEHYFVVGDALQQENTIHVCDGGWYLGATQLTVICILQLKNGYVVVGVSTCTDFESFDSGIARKIAYDDALKQVWELLEYEHRSKLKLEEGLTALEQERDQLLVRFQKLSDQVNTDMFTSLGSREQQDLSDQLMVMEHYLNILNSRISRQ